MRRYDGAHTVGRDPDRYVLAPARGLFLTATVTNVSREPVILSACNSFVVPVPELQTGKDWTAFPFISCGDHDLSPLSLQPGESISVEAELQSVGTFRLRVPLYVADSVDRLSPETSPEFVVY